MSPSWKRRVALLFLLATAAANLGAAPDARLTGAFAPGDSGMARAAGSAPGQVWDSNRPEGDGLGRLEVDLPATGNSLALSVNGFPDNSTLRLSLQTPDHLRELRLGVRSAPGPAWCLYRWTLPAAWRGRPAVLVAEDNSAKLWLGVGLPTSSSSVRAAHWSAALASLSAVILTVLPFFAALVLLGPRFPQDEPMRVTLALIAAGLFALAAFFGFFLSHVLGLVVVAAGLLAVVFAGVRFVRQKLSFARVRPLLATIALAGVVVSTLYLYGGDESPEGVPAGRHDLGLPTDNLIPDFFAERIYRHEALRPFLEDWLTSDRPPLQTGFLLVARPILDVPAARIATATTCQLAAYAGLWVLLGALGIPRRTARLVLLACVTSGFFLLNTLYAWPKLLPAGFLLAAAGLLYRLLRQARRASLLESFALGACAALAMLGHGGSFFGLAALGIVYLVHGGWRDRRLIVGAALVAFLVYSPWLAYQRWVDPPGDRLLKYHLAGHRDVDPRGALTVIAEAYQRTPAAEILHNKWTNVRVLAGDFTNVLPGVGRSALEFFTGDGARAWWRFSNAMQGGEFFHLVQSLGFLLVGLPFLWLRRREPGVAPANYCVAVALTSIVVWCALMFGPEGTVIHQGTYLTGALLMVAAVLGLVASGRPRLVRSIIGLHLALWLGIWVFSPTWDPWHEVLRPTWSGFWLIAWLMALALLVGTGWRLAVGVETPPPAETPHA
ncbi:MAG TPA: hypothetical protein VL200_10975 [Lacunisphaera sp.]|jgi:hypothetical protein|nr:hypothetical protein [Lacunisphaera sp.]